MKRACRSAADFVVAVVYLVSMTDLFVPRSPSTAQVIDRELARFERHVDRTLVSSAVARAERAAERVESTARRMVWVCALAGGVGAGAALIVAGWLG